MTEPRTPPPVDTALISESPGELRMALLRGGEPWELVIARAHRPSLVGHVYLGRVTRIVAGLAAAFVDIGGGEAFLPLRRDHRPSEGDAIRVQIARDAPPGKSAVLSGRIRLPGRLMVYLPGEAGVAASRRIAPLAERQRLQGLLLRRLGPGEGAVLRAAAERSDEAALAAELAALRRRWAAIERQAGPPPRLLHEDEPPLLRFLRDDVPATVARTLIEGRAAARAAAEWAERWAPEIARSLRAPAPAEPLLERYGIEEEIEQALANPVELAGGARLSIWPTPALTAVDVDSGGLVERGGAAATVRAANLSAAAALARLIRFRSLSGQIVIDFADMAGRAAPAEVERTLRAGLADDRAAVRLLPISELGLLQLSRERIRPPLHEVLGDACRCCAGIGRVAGAETLALAALRAVMRHAAAAPGPPPMLRCSAAIRDALLGPLAAARAEAERALGGALPISVESGAPADRFRVGRDARAGGAP